MFVIFSDGSVGDGALYGKKGSGGGDCGCVVVMVKVEEDSVTMRGYMMVVMMTGV